MAPTLPRGHEAALTQEESPALPSPPSLSRSPCPSLALGGSRRYPASWHFSQRRGRAARRASWPTPLREGCLLSFPLPMLPASCVETRCDGQAGVVFCFGGGCTLERCTVCARLHRAQKTICSDSGIGKERALYVFLSPSFRKALFYLGKRLHQRA